MGIQGNTKYFPELWYAQKIVGLNTCKWTPHPQETSLLQAKVHRARQIFGRYVNRGDADIFNSTRQTQVRSVMRPVCGEKYLQVGLSLSFAIVMLVQKWIQRNKKLVFM